MSTESETTPAEPTITPNPAETPNPTPESETSSTTTEETAWTDYSPDFAETFGEIPIDQGLSSGFVEIVNTEKVPHDTAEKFLNLYKDSFDSWTKNAPEPVKSFEDTVDEFASQWMEQAQKLPEIGGEHLEKTMTGISTLLKETLPSEEVEVLATELDRTGMGNNPQLIQVLHAAAKLIEESKPIPAGNPIPKADDNSPSAQARRRYPNSY